MFLTTECYAKILLNYFFRVMSLTVQTSRGCRRPLALAMSVGQTQSLEYIADPKLRSLLSGIASAVRRQRVHR